MLARPAHAALLLACVTCNSSTTAAEPPAQPAELVTAAALALPSLATPDVPSAAAPDRLDPLVARRYREALRTGAAQTDAGDLSAAISAFSAALADVPDDPRALAGRGHAHLLARDLAAAADDLRAAAARAGEFRLISSVHHDLAVLAEHHRRGDEAIKHLALAELFHPNSAIADKLAGRTTCLADVALGPATPPRTRPTSWRELWTAHFEPSKANLKDPSVPVDETAARLRVCHYEALALDACAGLPPWVLRIPGGEVDPERGRYADQYVLVDLASNGALAVAPLVDLEMNTTCDDHYDVAIVGRDPIVVRTTHTPNALGDVCETPDDPDAAPHCYIDCVHARRDTITTVHARDTLAVLLTVTSPNRPGDDTPLASVRVSTGGATISGGGCERTIPLPGKPQ